MYPLLHYSNSLAISAHVYDRLFNSFETSNSLKSDTDRLEFTRDDVFLSEDDLSRSLLSLQYQIVYGNYSKEEMVVPCYPISRLTFRRLNFLTTLLEHRTSHTPKLLLSMYHYSSMSKTFQAPASQIPRSRHILRRIQSRLR